MSSPSSSKGNPAKRPRPSTGVKKEPEELAVPVVATTNLPARPAVDPDAPLIPSDCASAREGTQSFCKVFQFRYGGENGSSRAPFFIGSLQEAINEAFDKPLIADRRALALYIHHDGSLSRRAFAEEILCYDETVALLRSNFVLWPWDVTAKENQQKLMSWLVECDLYSVLPDVTRCLSDFHAGQDEDVFPLLLLVTKDQGGFKLRCSIIAARNDLSSTIEALTAATNLFAEDKSAEIRRKIAQRSAR